jgi:hypothetical protein
MRRDKTFDSPPSKPSCKLLAHVINPERVSSVHTLNFNWRFLFFFSHSILGCNNPAIRSVSGWHWQTQKILHGLFGAVMQSKTYIHTYVHTTYIDVGVCICSRDQRGPRRDNLLCWLLLRQHLGCLMKIFIAARAGDTVLSSFVS